MLPVGRRKCKDYSKVYVGHHKNKNVNLKLAKRKSWKMFVKCLVRKSENP